MRDAWIEKGEGSQLDALETAVEKLGVLVLKYVETLEVSKTGWTDEARAAAAAARAAKRNGAPSMAAQHELHARGWLHSFDGEYTHSDPAMAGHRLRVEMRPTPQYGGRPHVAWTHTDQDGNEMQGAGVDSLGYHLMRQNQRYGVDKSGESSPLASAVADEVRRLKSRYTGTTKSMVEQARKNVAARGVRLDGETVVGPDQADPKTGGHLDGRPLHDKRRRGGRLL